MNSRTPPAKEPAAASRSDPKEAGPALFRLVRFWSRRWINRASEEITGEMRHVQHILVVEAVSIAESVTDPTITTVAHQLGLDHSGASRRVRDATAAGYIRREASPHDRRQAALQLTEKGQDLLNASRQWQRLAFERLTADWTEDDRARLTGYLQRLARDLEAS